MRHGSEPFAMNPSVSRMTGVMCSIAMEHMTPVILLTDGFIANGSEPWRIPSMKDSPTICPPIVETAPEDGFMPYVRNEKMVRGWAFPGKTGLEHRVGGLEKDAV